MKTIKPNSLKAGDLLGVVACSTPITGLSEDARKRAYQRIGELGFRVKEAPNCRQENGHSAGSIQERVDALHEMFKNPEIAGILSFWGGFQSHQLLEYLDFDLIRKNPKPFIGYSDTTALQIAIHTMTGLVSFSGPAVVTFSKPELPSFTLEYFKKVLIHPETSLRIGFSESFSDNPWYLEPDKKMIFKPNPGPKIFRHGKAFGIAIGGNVGTMLLLAGTKYWPDLNGKILFFEDDEAESPETIDRMFTQLRQMGAFEKLAGLVVGRFPSSVGFQENDSLEMILDDAVRGYQIPVITGVDFGHTDPLITIPIGIRCQVNTENLNIEFTESAVAEL